MSEEKTMQVVLHRRKESYDPEYRYSIHERDMSQYGYTVVSEKQVTFSLPTEIEMIIAEVNATKLELQKKQAEAWKEAQALQEKIAKLLTVTYKVEPDEVDIEETVPADEAFHQEGNVFDAIFEPTLVAPGLTEGTIDELAP